MRVSLRWLQEYIDLADLTIGEISSTLTQLGLEVEGIELLAPLKGDVVVGQILKAVTHPNADKLRVCTVDVGKGEALKIVCGAPNARDGIKVVVARIGSVLPKDFKIKESKIRGEDSFGMLCSEAELGLSEGHDGIIELPADAPLGLSVSEYWQLEDTIIEIGLTPNRSDCLGIIGIARDLSARLKRPLRVPTLHPAWHKEDLDSTSKVRVQISSAQESLRFVALHVGHVTAASSPVWLQQRVQRAGMRAINLIVDATNYVMLETGHPIHAYDERDLRGGLIQVRRAHAGEKLKTLDGQDRDLHADDIVIADAEQAIGLAGIMGGANSEVKSDTQNIIIEVAHFNPSLIRKTAKRQGIHTEASHRFERGIDVERLAWVAQRVAEVIYLATQELKDKGQDLPLPEIASRWIDVESEARSIRRVTLRLSRLRKMTALPQIDGTEMTEILSRLGFKLAAETGDVYEFETPSWRQDIDREVDLIEEVVRVYGYDRIPVKLPRMELGALPEHPLIDFIDESKVSFAGFGLSEVITFPFMSGEDFAALGIDAEHPLAATVKLANPLVEHEKHLRSIVLTGLIKSLLENRRHGIQGAQLFEAARSFHEPRALPTEGLSPVWGHLKKQGAHISLRAHQDDRVLEHNRIAGLLDQPFTMKSWNQGEQAASFFQGKSLLLRYLRGFGIESLRFTPIEAKDFPWLHPGAAAVLWSQNSQFLGYVGELHPRTAKAYGLDFQNTPVVFELDLEAIQLASCQPASYASGSVKFPPVARDLALVVASTISYSDFERSFASFKQKKHLKTYRVFDVYQGTNIPAGKKSMAFSLQFQAADRTLTDQDVEKELEALLVHLKGDLSAELR